jgi:membrane protein required for colicin V production
MVGWLDIIIVTTALIAGFLGLRLGAVRGAATLAGMAAAALLVSRQQQDFGLLTSGPLAGSQAGHFIGSLVLPLAVFVGAVVLGVVLRRVVRFLLLGWLDRAVGGAVGLALAAGVWLFLAQVLAPALGGQANDAVADSLIAQTIAEHAPEIVEFVSAGMNDLPGGSLATRAISSVAGMVN